MLIIIIIVIYYSVAEALAFVFSSLLPRFLDNAPSQCVAGWMIRLIITFDYN